VFLFLFFSSNSLLASWGRLDRFFCAQVIYTRTHRILYIVATRGLGYIQSAARSRFTGFIMPPSLIDGGIKRCFCLTSVCLSVAYIGPNSRTERHRKTKIGTEVAHVTRNSDTTFKVKGQGHQAALVGCTGTGRPVQPKRPGDLDL